MVIDLLIKNGTVVNPEGVVKADVAISKGKIVGIGNKGLFEEAKEVIDAKDTLLFPGGVDSHTHFETPFQGAVPKETWETGTKAAAIGGTTTAINFSIQKKGRPLMDSINVDIERANKLAVIDFAFHGAYTDFSDMDAVINEIPELFKAGITSIKEFMIYKRQGFMIDDWMLFNILNKIKEYGGFVGVHAENAPIGEGFREKLTEDGKTATKYHPISKPNFVEAEAIQRACSIAKFAGSKLYIAHMSTKEGVQIIKSYKNKSLPMYSETCTHYLTLTEKVHQDEGKLGIYSLLSPPLRREEDIKALWKGLEDGDVSLVGSDHAPFLTEHKMQGWQKEGFMGVANGAPGIFERMPVVYSEGVCKGKISLTTYVKVTSTNAAKMFGLYPRKGIIAPSSDADIVVFDPEKEVSLCAADWYEDIDWSLYENMKIKGFPEMTLIRGKVVAKDGKCVANAGYGGFIKGKMNEDAVSTV